MSEEDDGYLSKELTMDILARVLKAVDAAWVEVIKGIGEKYVEPREDAAAVLIAYGVVLGYFNESLERRMRRIPNEELAKQCEQLIMDVEKLTAVTLREFGDNPPPTTDWPVGNIKWN